MSYQTFHGVGSGPFRPNKDRGSWANPHDFVLACLNNALRVDNIYGLAVVHMVISNGIANILVLLLNGVLFAVPMFFIQSFLGQFSSSGLISALRISPLFKGLGYVALGVNLISLTFHSVLIAVPMMFFLHSMQPTLPWSCDAPRPWEKEMQLKIPINETVIEVDIFTSHCDLNYSLTSDVYQELVVPSVEFFRHQLNHFNVDIFACVLVVWAAMAYAAYQGSEKIGIFLRKSTLVVLVLLVILFIRLLFLPDITKHMTTERSYYTTSWFNLAIIMPAIMTFMTLGPGCGSVLSLASYNNFKTDIVKFSWQVPLCQLGVLLMLGTVSFSAEMHLIKNQQIIPPLFDYQWMNFMTIPSTLAMMELAHLWTWLFLIMIILTVFNMTLIQMLTVQTAVSDEFEQLRPLRKKLILGTSAALALASAVFCTEKGIAVIEMVVDMNHFSQCLLNVILFIVVLWVYGRDRFRRDVEFMTSQVLSDWLFHYVRLVAPVFLGIMFFLTFLFGLDNYAGLQEVEVAVGFFVAYFPWLALPAFGAYVLRQAIGDWRQRLSRCVKATDWFPVDPEEKQRYDEMFSSKEPSQALATNVV